METNKQRSDSLYHHHHHHHHHLNFMHTAVLEDNYKADYQPSKTTL
jgi:hypothetical protein